ncbi:MAG: hypothetical protein R3Y09_05445 [Clostridia bacterium]
MRRLISLAAILAITTSLMFGCSSTKDDRVDDTIIPDVEEGIDDLVDDFDLGMDDLDENFEEMYQDGVYRAEFTEYTDGYKDYVEITIKDGKIEKVEHDGLNEMDELKSIDEDLKTRYLDEYQTYPEEFMPMYSSSLLDYQSLDMMESYNGTETEFANFKRLAEQALMSAKTGKTETSTIDTEDNMDTRAQY